MLRDRIDMLVIREEQIEKLGRESILRFEDRMVVVLGADYPQRIQPMAEQAVRELIRSGIAFAKSHGIVDEGGVAAVIGLVVQYGKGFAHSPDREWAMQVLGHKSAPGPLKVELLIGRMAARAGGRVVRDFPVAGNE